MEDKRRPDSRGARLRVGRPEQAVPPPGLEKPKGWGLWNAAPSTGAGDFRNRPLGGPIPRILLVGDAPAGVQAQRDALSVFEAEVVEAFSGVDALRAVREGEFGLILIGTGIHDVDCFELAQLLRQEPGADAVPVLLIVPEHDPAALKMGYRSGAADCLVSTDIETLRTKVRMFLEMHAKRAELRGVAERMSAEIQRLEEATRELREQRESLQRQATFDPLTHLPNRLLFEDRLDGALKRAARSRQ